jgi:hypothetical protein
MAKLFAKRLPDGYYIVQCPTSVKEVMGVDESMLDPYLPRLIRPVWEREYVCEKCGKKFNNLFVYCIHKLEKCKEREGRGD